MRRVGILGGTFDPPHEAHLEMARLARDRLTLDEVVFVPVLSPSHKSEASAPFADRLEMVRRLIAGEPRLAVSAIEAGLGPKSYTVPMLEALRRETGPDARFFFIIGADSLTQIHLWFQYREILQLATVVAISRPGHRLENPCLSPVENAAILQIDDLALPLASRDYRTGASCPLPPAIEAYVRERRLYGR